MRFRTGGALAILAAAGFLVGTAAHVHAAELGFLEMLFGARPAPQQVQTAQPPADGSFAYRRPRNRVGAARHRLRTQYAALPVRIHVGERQKPLGDRQTPIDMTQGAAAALLKDETLRPGDIVVLSTGARVFTGDPDKRHTMNDFDSVQRSPYVNKTTRKLLAGMLTPVGALPADEARRVVALMRKAVPPTTPAVTQATAMRVIYPWPINR